MSFHVRADRQAFAESAAWVAAAIGRNPETPILAGMQVIAANGSIWISGSDRDTTHRATLPADVKVEGEILVSGRFLSQIVAAMSGVTVELEVVESRLVVGSGRSTYRVGTMDPDSYPTLPAFPKHVGTMDAVALSNALGTVEHAVSKNPTLAALTAYNLVGDAGGLAVSATDRFRLARTTAQWADASGSEFAANVPALALTAAVKGLSGDVEIGSDGGSFGLRDQSRSIVTRALGEELQFPKLAPIFAREPIQTVTAESAPIVEALKRARLIADENETVVVEFSDGLITVSTDGKTSDGSEDVDADAGFGEGEMALKFSADHLAQALIACPADRVTFGLIAPAKQVLIQPVGSSAASFIVMPRQLS